MTGHAAARPPPRYTPLIDAADRIRPVEGVVANPHGSRFRTPPADLILQRQESMVEVFERLRHAL